MIREMNVKLATNYNDDNKPEILAVVWFCWSSELMLNGYTGPKDV